MSDGNRVRTAPGDASPLFPNAHAISDHVRSRHGFPVSPNQRNLRLGGGAAARLAKLLIVYAIPRRNKMN